MAVQVTLGFATDLGKGGAWDEVYQTNFTDVNVAAAAWNASTNFFGLTSAGVLGKRLACLSEQCYMYYARFGLIDTDTPQRANLVQGLSVGYRGSENFAADCASLRVFTTGGSAHRQIRLGGLPDNVVDGNAIQTGFVQSYILGSSGFLQAYAAAGGVIRFRNTLKAGPSSRAIKSVVKVNQDSLISVVVDTPIEGLAENSTVIISVRGQPQFRGTWTVANVNSDHTTITLRGSQRVSSPANPGGYLTLGSWSIAPFAATNGGQPFNPSIVGLSAHKLGKKKYQLRGRRSPILIRH